MSMKVQNLFTNKTIYLLQLINENRLETRAFEIACDKHIVHLRFGLCSVLVIMPP